jgi:glyceraldehyde 3-phosphate dehydrogenase
MVDMVMTKKKDLRRCRSGMTNLAPTSTGSATAIATIFPELKGKLNGLAIRVPLLNASITDCVFEVEKSTTVEEVNELMRAAAAEGPLKGNYLNLMILCMYTEDTQQQCEKQLLRLVTVPMCESTY